MPANVECPRSASRSSTRASRRGSSRKATLVEAGEALVELETEKVNVDVPAPQAGVLGQIAHGDGADVHVGDVLATIDDCPRSRSGQRQLATLRARSRQAGSRDAGSRKPAAGAGSATPAAREPRATPAARNVAQEHGVDLGRCPATGAAGRVTKRDVETAIAQSQRPSPPAPAALRASPPRRATPHGPARRDRRRAGAHVAAPRRPSRSAWSRRSAPRRC